MSNPSLITPLIDRHPGTALVIGGGPRAPWDLDTLHAAGFRPSVTLSANEHGHLQALYPPTYSVGLDDRHGASRRLMRDVLAEFGVPIVGPGWYADYRIPEWVLAANCGLSAIVVAQLLGAGAVVVVGVDCYRALDPGAETYFHAPAADSNSLRKAPSNFVKQIQKVKQRLDGAVAVRPVSGFLVDHWPSWKPAEGLPAKPAKRTDFVEYVAGREQLIVEAHPRGFPIGGGQAPGRTRVALSRAEAERHTRARKCRIVDPPDHPLTRLNRGRAPSLI